MNARKIALASISIPLLALSACSEKTEEAQIKPSEITNQDQFNAYQSQQAQKKEEAKVDPAKIGDTYNWDCTKNSPCEIAIKVTEITPVTPCPYGSYSETPGKEGKKYVLMKGELEGIETENFDSVTNFEQINKDGFTESIMDGAHCMNPTGEGWGTDVSKGEKKQVAGVFEVSDDAKKISIEGLYFYDIPAVDPIVPNDAKEPEWMSDDMTVSEPTTSVPTTTYRPNAPENCVNCIGDPSQDQQGGWAPGYGPNGPLE